MVVWSKEEGVTMQRCGLALLILCAILLAGTGTAAAMTGTLVPGQPVTVEASVVATEPQARKGLR
jgi:hypothetical protein